MTNGKSYEVTTIMYNYEHYKEPSVYGRYVRHSQVADFIKKINSNSQFKVSNVGSSFEGREINLIQFGTGDIKLFLWSQMHGDESTSTRAILDLLNFFSSNDENHAIRDKLLRNLTLYIIPMLNPDGAEKFTRRNAQQIDINRDALTLQTAEGKILYQTKNRIKPNWGFNLHDQSSGYSAGVTNKSSTISLLAPPFNSTIAKNETRESAMKLIVSLFQELNEVIPGHIARYDDEFEPRAFGDNFTKDGVSTVLIEAGGWNTDPDREYVRKLFFLSLIKSLLTISDQRYTNEDANLYNEIPENKERLFDLVLRNVTMSKNNSEYRVDIAVKREPYLDPKTNHIYYKGTIADIGDLSTFYGYQEQDMSGYTFENPKINFDKDQNITELLQNGFLFSKNTLADEVWTKKTMNYFNDVAPNCDIKIDGLANFSLASSGNIKYVVINGYLIDLSKTIDFNGNCLIFT